MVSLSDALTAPMGASTSRSLAAILSDVASPEDFSSLQAAITARRNVEGRAGASYTFSNVTLSNSQSFNGNNCLLTPSANANAFIMNSYAPRIERIYFSNSTSISEAIVSVGVSGSNSLFGHIGCLQFPNPGAAKIIDMKGSATYAIEKWTVEKIEATGIQGTGINIGSSVVHCTFDNLKLMGKINYDGGGKGLPTSGATGVRVNSPVIGGITTGGHTYDKVNCEALDKGWHFTDAQLTKISDSFADGCRDYGLRIDGASSAFEIVDFFCGFTQGIYVGGTSTGIYINGLVTNSNGVVPSWGQAPYYNNAGPFYDVTVADTAVLHIDGDAWRGTKKVSVAGGATLVVTGGTWFRGKNVGNVTANTTTYLSEQGHSATEGDAFWRAPHAGYLFLCNPLVNVAPGVGQSYTYTVRVNGVDTAMVATISGAGAFEAKTYGPIFVAAGATISIKLVTSAAAAATACHRCAVQFLGL